MDFVTELKHIADQVILITCNDDKEKKLLNNQLMFLAMAVTTKEQYLEAIIRCYKSKTTNFIKELEQIKI